MKKIILLAIMLGLVGCGENGSSDVASPTNNQSTELTSNNIQQASARSISTYSMTVPFDGWHLFNPNARIQENACWSPVDPNHLIELNNNRNALSRCEN